MATVWSTVLKIHHRTKPKRPHFLCGGLVGLLLLPIHEKPAVQVRQTKKREQRYIIDGHDVQVLASASSSSFVQQQQTVVVVVVVVFVVVVVHLAQEKQILPSPNCSVHFVCVYMFIQTFVFLKTWFPGDPTLRRISESSLKLMFSRSGFSFGTSRVFSKRYSSVKGGEGEVKLRNPKETRQTKKQYVVQGQIPDRPTWGEDFDIHKYVKDVRLGEKGGGGEEEEGYKQLQCFFTVDANEPKVVLYDDGRTHVVHLGVGNTGINMNELTCEHFRATTSVGNDDRIEETWSIESEGENVGKLAIVSSATNVEMLSEYHRTLLNHLEYAKSHKYANYLSLVKQKTLEGRSGKFAKHLAMGALISTGDFDTVCHVDLDAWFASWAPLSYYAKAWPRDKDLLFGDTDQIWINSGLMIARTTTWSAQFFEKVMNAVHSVNAENDEKIGFKRDQPAVWHVLAEGWREEGRMPYKGTECESWNQCNPDENPVECWHWCHWDALQRIKGWTGLTSLNALPNIHLVPIDVYPQMHRMCIRSCYSVAARAVDGHLLGNYTRLGDVLAERRGQDEFVRRERVLGANGIQRRGVVEAYRASTLERRSAELRAKK